ncbi:toxin-antitoxin system YwqK family antitoxin [Nonomuraea sp. MTCD27]|uniref:toxin-antitoxin system YwqK family antitoxin n=1 Tax=Nonomuraea sp. MTCD27 TaxID=1676747 RepID=UPI0035C248CA
MIMLRVPLDDTYESEEDRVTYNGVWLTGVAVETRDDGTLLGETTFKNGIQDGPERAWWPGGGLRLERVYDYGLPVHEREWHANGQLAHEVHLDRGRLVSQEWWDEAGNPISRP